MVVTRFYRQVFDTDEVRGVAVEYTFRRFSPAGRPRHARIILLYRT